MTTLNEQFDTLDDHLSQLIGLLEECDERFWVPYLKRGLRQVREHKLSGATFVLGCYGGAETFSDLVIGRRFQQDDPLRFHNLNARLTRLRTLTFESANAITARRTW